MKLATNWFLVDIWLSCKQIDSTNYMARDCVIFNNEKINKKIERRKRIGGICTTTHCVPFQLDLKTIIVYFNNIYNYLVT
jgi:hypothetical protein